MAERRPLILDGGLMKELPSGDSLPTPDLGAPITLAHSAGTITLDVSAGQVFEFEADDTVEPEINVVGSFTEVNSNSSFHTLDLPAGAAAGDYVVLVVGGRYDSSSYKATVQTAGYTLIHEEVSSGDVLSQVFGKFITDDTNIQTSVASAVADNTAYACAAFRGVDTSSPLDVAVQVAYSASASINPAGVTTVTDNAVVVAALSAALYNALSITPPAGYTSLNSSRSANSDAAAGLIYKEVPTAGSEDPGSFTYGDADSFTRAVTLALRPDAGSGFQADYTLSLTNKPTTIKLIRAYLETKTGVGVWDVSDIDEWIGDAPAFDSAGVHVIDLQVSAARTVGEYLGVAA